mgnify:CR=1 FL=1
MFMNYVTLINKDNLIKDKYFKYLELSECIDIYGNASKLEKNTLLAFNELRDYLLSMNIEIGIDSAYRSLDEQQQIIDEFKKKYGNDYTNFVAPLRASEHHTALAIDLSIKKDREFLTDNDELFANEEVFREISKNLHKFGFILRYPKGKERITGYSYEPWHIRYVGVVPATIMYKNKLTLEEYINNFSGVLLINKESGMTSRDVVNEVSKILGIKKMGHTGTLDPMAEGVLVLTVGRATKLGELLTSKEKEYVAGVDIGYLTDTLDSTGNVIKEKIVQHNINYKDLLKSFNKTYLQEVPIYSAVKVNGKKLYEYARSGKKVEIEPREIEIFDIDLISISKDMKEIVYKVWCSKGTYIRSLCEDIAERLGTVGFMSGLNRTRVGDFRIEQAVRISDVTGDEGVVNRDIIKSKFISIEEFLMDKNEIVLDNMKIRKFLNGVKIFCDKSDGIYRVYSENRVFVGSGIAKDKKLKRDIIINF